MFSFFLLTESNISWKGSKHIEREINDNRNIQNTSKHHIIKLNDDDHNHTKRHVAPITLHHSTVALIGQ